MTHHRLHEPGTQRRTLVWIVQLLLAWMLMMSGAAHSEPYLAVRTGQKCMACHVNPTGGGKRTEFGNTYSQTALASAGAEPAPWSGKISDHFAIGGDLRATAQGVKVPGSTNTFAFNQTRAQVYLELKPIGERLSIYLDERVAPGASTNRETYALLWFAQRSVYLKAGRMFVPFGLRIEDDTAFIRQVTGVNFNASDDGVEGGLESGPWSAYVAVTNGAGGGAETNRGKLVSSLATYVQPGWRVGVSVSANSNDNADRRMQNAFAGLRTGIVSWLASAVFITDDGTPTGKLKQRVALLEGNVEVARGHNARLSYEYHDPNVDVREDQRARYSAVWEYVPFPYTQFRLGARKSDGIPQNNAQNATEAFMQWHAFF